MSTDIDGQMRRSLSLSPQSARCAALHVAMGVTIWTLCCVLHRQIGEALDCSYLNSNPLVMSPDIYERIARGRTHMLRQNNAFTGLSKPPIS